MLSKLSKMSTVFKFIKCNYLIEIDTESAYVNMANVQKVIIYILW